MRLPWSKNKISKFIDFLHEFSVGIGAGGNGNQAGDSNDLYGTHHNGFYSLAIVPIGNKKTTRKSYFGYEPYTRFISKAMQDGITVFYILAGGRINIHIAEAVAEELEERNMVRMSDKYVEEVKHGNCSVKRMCMRLEKSTQNELAQHNPS